MSLDVLDIVKLRGEGVLDVDDDDLPVRLLFVEEGHDAQDLDLLHLAGVADKLADLAHVEGVVVALGLGLGVDVVGVLPCLGSSRSLLAAAGGTTRTQRVAYLGEGTIVPEVALVREAVADVAQLALLGVLLDGVEELLLGDLSSI